MTIHFFDPVMGVNRTIDAPPATHVKRVSVRQPTDVGRLTRPQFVAVRVPEPKGPRRSRALEPTIPGHCTTRGCTNPRVPPTSDRGRPPSRCVLHVKTKAKA